MAYPTYTISEDTSSGTLNLGLMHAEVAALSFGSAVLQGINVNGTTFTVSFDIEPSTG